MKAPKVNGPHIPIMHVLCQSEALWSWGSSYLLSLDHLIILKSNTMATKFLLWTSRSRYEIVNFLLISSISQKVHCYKIPDPCQCSIFLPCVCGGKYSWSQHSTKSWSETGYYAPSLPLPLLRPETEPVLLQSLHRQSRSGDEKWSVLWQICGQS